MEKVISKGGRESLGRIENGDVEIAASNQVYDRNVLGDISKELEQLQKIVNDDQELAIKLRESLNLVLRAINQFKVLDKMIIVTCGMLKAGKSTLINLLARNDMASPVDFGVDTTLRPAVVRMGESTQDGWIYCYYLQEGVEDGVDHKSEGRAALRQIFDKLRGLPLMQPEKFYCEQVPLTRTNLHDFLCCKKPKGASMREPMLVVVETTRQSDDSCLLANGNMLLDMPGLDSATAEISTQIDDYAEVVSECDMMFYVQSSVSPLNSQAQALLTKVLKHRHPETTFVIQNCMEAQWWRTPELQERAQEHQAKSAQEGVLRCFREYGSKLSLSGVRCQRMNLGMAYDAAVEPDDKLNVEGVMPDREQITGSRLRERSRFEGFENEVRKLVREHGLGYRVRHCRDGLLKSIDALRGELKSHIDDSIIPKLAEERQHLDSWERVKLAFEKILNTAELSDRPQSICLAGGFAKCINADKIRQEVLTSKPEYGPFKKQGSSVNGSLIDSFLRDCTALMAKKLEESFNRIALKDVDVQIRDEKQGLSTFMNDSLREFVFDKCNESSSEERGLEEYFNRVRREARPGYSFTSDLPLPDDYRKPFISVLEPSQTFKQTKWLIWEVEFGVGNVDGEAEKLQNKYCDVAKSRLEEVGDDMINKLFDDGKKKGFERTLTYVKNRIADSSENLESVRKKQELSERCVNVVTDIESKIGGICHD